MDKILIFRYVDNLLVTFNCLLKLKEIFDIAIKLYMFFWDAQAKRAKIDYFTKNLSPSVF